METTSPDEVAEYRRRSYVNWQAAAAGWEREHALVQATLRPVTEWMIDRLGPRPGEAIVELGAGMGEVGMEAARLVAPNGRVIVSDRAPGMVAAAQRRAAALGLANVEARVLDLESIDLETGSVDGVLCRLALMLVPDRARAVGEVRRVLRAEGRGAFAVWAAAEENPWATALWDALEEEAVAPQTPAGGPGMFALADPAAIRRLLAGAGLEATAIEPIAVEWAFAGFAEYWRSQTTLNGGLARLLPVLAPERQERIADVVRVAVERFRTADGYRARGMVLGVLAVPAAG